MNVNCGLVKNGHRHLADGGGGGTVVAANTLTIRRTLAIGDSLAATVVADRLIDMGYEITWQTHAAVHCVIRRHPRIYSVVEPGYPPDINLDGAYEQNPMRRRLHFHDMFMAVAAEQLQRFGINPGKPFNCRPTLRLPPADRAAAANMVRQHPRPWIFICPRSESYNVRQVHDGTWRDMAPQIKGTKFWLGRHPAPEGIVDLKLQHFDHVLQLLSVADLLVSVDTGPLHVAAALDVPCVAICQSSSPELHLSDQCDYVMVSPPLNCLNCQVNVCPIQPALPPCQAIDPGIVSAWANARVNARTNGLVSAVISVYRPDVETLNRCLECVLPQVHEIIVCNDLAGQVPHNALRHPKIKYVTKMLSDIGYGRKQNYAARHSNGEYLLLMNDDVFLNPECVTRMLEPFKDQRTGMVSPLLRYPDGTIYHAGKRRGPGAMGWGHIAHRHRDPEHNEPAEMENLCGATVMVRRSAFYQINGFDEEFYLYAEDDDMSLRMRRAGYKLVFTPFASGIHMEHQSTKKTGDIMEIVGRANGVFSRKWRRYLEHNANNVPFGNFDY